MTESEAKQLQCCGPDGCGQLNDRPYPARWCVGSGCMAWRSLSDEHQYVDLPDDQEPEGDGWVKDGEGLEVGETTWTRQVARGGYCGLAGHP